MTARVVNPKRKQAWLRLPHLAIADLAALIAPADHAGATGDRSERSVESIERTAGEPIALNGEPVLLAATPIRLASMRAFLH
jgi:hypothetical protein